MTAIDPRQCHPLIRYRRSVGLAASALCVVLYLTHALHWHWPYNPPGMIGEFSALALSAGLGLAAGVATGRWFAFARFVGRWPAAAAFALFFYVVLRVSDPFAGERYWLYAPPECDFDIRFPRRATVIASETNVAGGAALRVERAIYTDIGLALTLSAECSGHGAATGGGERAGLRATAASTLRRIAQNTGLKVHSVDEALADSVVLHALDDSGRDSQNNPILRQIEARAEIGPRSVLVLWTWSIAPDAASVPEAARRFMNGFRRRGPQRSQ